MLVLFILQYNIQKLNSNHENSRLEKIRSRYFIQFGNIKYFLSLLEFTTTVKLI